MNYYKTLILRLAIPFLLSFNILNKIFYPLTIYVPYYIMKLINYTVLIHQPYLITFNNYIRFSEACAAISAYFLLILLIVLTKNLDLKTGLKMFLIGSLIIFTTNILRILALIIVLEKKGFNTFQETHDILWIIFGSMIVALTWISLIRHYKVKSIPLYSDLKYLLKQTKIFK